jgi:hypothetical protein
VPLSAEGEHGPVRQLDAPQVLAGRVECDERTVHHGGPLDGSGEVQAGGRPHDRRVPRVDRAGAPHGGAEAGGHPDHRADVAEVARVVEQYGRTG